MSGRSLATFTGTLTEREADRLEDELGDATVANIPSAGQFTVTTHTEGESPIEAAATVMRRLNPDLGGAARTRGRSRRSSTSAEAVC